MLAYIFRRLLVAVPVLLLLIVLTFVLMYAAPGSPFATERGVPEAVLKNLEREYGLDQPFPVQIWTYVTNVVMRFDFGPSFVYRDQDVNDLIEQGFPVTLTYGFWSVRTGRHPWLARLWGSWPQSAIIHGAGLCSPSASPWARRCCPISCSRRSSCSIFTALAWAGCRAEAGRAGRLQYLILPVIALSTSFMASIARIARASMLEVMTSNFIRTARAKGLPNAPHRPCATRSKPALLPVISYLGPAFVGMITGSVVIDIYFSTGGIGQFFVASALARDYGVMMGITVLLGALTILFNLLVDIAYAWIDPKIRY